MTKRIGLIGAGPWGQLILRDLLALGAEVFVWSKSESSRMAALHQGATAISENIVDLPTVDGFVVATSAATHVEMIEAIAHHGVPIFVEKPLCTDALSAERLAELLPDRLFVMDKWRYHNGVKALQNILANGEIGELVGLKTVRIGNPSLHRETDDATWTLAPHDLSISLQIVGEIGKLQHATGHVDQTGIFHYASATLLLSTGAWHNLEVGDQTPITRREVLLIGTDGTAVLSGGYADQIEIRNNGGIRVERFEANMPLVEELTVFLDHIGGGTKPVSSAEDGAKTVRTISQIRAFIVSGGVLPHLGVD